MVIVDFVLLFVALVTLATLPEIYLFMRPFPWRPDGNELRDIKMALWIGAMVCDRPPSRGLLRGIVD